MANSGSEKGFWQSVKPVLSKIKEIFEMIGRAIGVVFSYMIRMHKFILAVPVILAALKLAQENMERLPEKVGLLIQQSGEYALLVSKDLAIIGPLAVTGICLVMMFCSRRTLYPWLISVFSLVLPLLIYVNGMFAV